MSPSNRKNDTELKLAVYREAGVEEYWIVDPEHECTYVRVITDEENSDHKHSKYYLPEKVYPFDTPVPSHIFTGLNIRIADLDYKIDDLL